MHTSGAHEPGHLRLVAPRQQLIDRPGVDHPGRIQSEILGSLTTVGLEFQLPGCVSVGVDGKQTTHVHSHLQQPGWWVAALGTRVDLHSDVKGPARFEDDFSVEDRLRPNATFSLNQTTGAVTQDVGTRIGNPTNHAMRHGLRVGAELGVDARHDDIQLSQQHVLLIKSALLKDVDLDASQTTKRRHDLVKVGYHSYLLA